MQTLRKLPTTAPKIKTMRGSNQGSLLRRVEWLQSYRRGGCLRLESRIHHGAGTSSRPVPASGHPDGQAWISRWQRHALQRLPVSTSCGGWIINPVVNFQPDGKSAVEGGWVFRLSPSEVAHDDSVSGRSAGGLDNSNVFTFSPTPPGR